MVKTVLFEMYIQELEIIKCKAYQYNMVVFQVYATGICRFLDNAGEYIPIQNNNVKHIAVKILHPKLASYVYAWYTEPRRVK